MVVTKTESSQLNTSFGPLGTGLAPVRHLPEVFAFRQVEISIRQGLGEQLAPALHQQT